MSSDEKVQGKSQTANHGSAMKFKLLRPVSGKGFQQKQPIESSENVFCQLRTNAFSMKQKLCRARQNIAVKSADLKKLKEDNRTTLCDVGKIKTSMALLNAQITQRGSSLTEFKQNSELFHEMFSSAEAIFHRNDQRLDAVGRCLQRLESETRNLSETLELSLKRSERLQAEKIFSLDLLQLSKEALLKVGAMTQEIFVLSSPIKADVLELTLICDSLSDTKNTTQKLWANYCFALDTIDRPVYDDTITMLSKEPRKILKNVMTALDKKLEDLQAIMNQLMEEHGNPLNFEQSFDSLSIFMKQMEETIASINFAVEEVKSCDFELRNNLQCLADGIEQAENCRKLLLINIDKIEKETEKGGEISIDELKICQRLESICAFKKEKEQYKSKIIPDLLVQISALSTFVENTSLWTDKCNCLTDKLKPTISEFQTQLAGNLALTFDNVERYTLDRNDCIQKLKDCLSLLSARSSDALNQKQCFANLQDKKKITKWLQNKHNFSSIELKALQQKKEHVVKVCGETIERTNKLTQLIRNLEQSNFAIAETIRAIDDTALQQQLLFEKENKRLRQEFEKNLCEMKTKKILEQFEREFSRINDFQERELDKKAKQLKVLMTRVKENTLDIKIGENLDRSNSVADTAASLLNGGRECIQSKLHSHYNLKHEISKILLIKPGDVPETKSSTVMQKPNRKHARTMENTMKRSEGNRNRKKSQKGGKDMIFNDNAVGACKSKSISKARHRRQAVKEKEPTLSSNSQEFDPFAFS